MTNATCAQTHTQRTPFSAALRLASLIGQPVSAVDAANKDRRTGRLALMVLPIEPRLRADLQTSSLSTLLANIARQTSGLCVYDAAQEKTHLVPTRLLFLCGPWLLNVLEACGPTAGPFPPDLTSPSLVPPQVEQIGCKIKFIEGDGNCLFRSLADQLEGRSQDHSFVRAKVGS